MRLHGFLERQRYTGLLWAPVAMGAGIAVYFSIRHEPDPRAALTLAGLALGLLALRLWLRQGALLLLLGLSALGFALAKVHTERMRAPVLEQIHFGPVSGRIVGFDRSSSNRLRLWLDRVHLPGLEPEDTPARVRVVIGGDTVDGALRPGARVMMRARLTPLPPPVEPTGFDFRRHAWFLGLGAIGFTAEPIVLARQDDGEGLPLLRARMALSRAIQGQMPPRSGGFAAAILTGDRSAIDPRDLVDLRASNLAHLLAISGLHMGLLTGAVFAMLRFGLVLIPGLGLRVPVKKFAALGALAAGASYLALSGASVATQRAFIMAAVIFAAVLADRPALTLRAVAISALIVLAWRPYSLLSPGFQMSFAATAALVGVYDGLRRWRWWQEQGRRMGPVARFLLGLLITSAVAGLATAPFAAFHFNTVPRYGLLANLMAVPLMGFVVMPAALVALALAPLGLQGVGFWLMHMGIARILDVAHWVAGLEGAVRHVQVAPQWVLGLLAAGLLVLLLVRGPGRLTGAAVAAAALMLWAVMPRPAALVAPGGGIVGVMGVEGRSLSRPRGEGFTARVWLENDGDAVEQKAAGARPALARSRDVFEADLPAGGRLIWTGAAVPAPDACTKAAILIAPDAERAPPGECVFLGRAALAQGGAYAFFDDLHRPQTSTQVQGVRPWTRTPFQ